MAPFPDVNFYKFSSLIPTNIQLQRCALNLNIKNFKKSFVSLIAGYLKWKVFAMKYAGVASINGVGGWLYRRFRNRIQSVMAQLTVVSVVE